MKIDLDELERSATSVKLLAHDRERRGWTLEPAFLGGNALVTLALIARIRELEDALRMQCDRLDMFHEAYTKVTKDPLNVREILDKGAVLPP